MPEGSRATTSRPPSFRGGCSPVVVNFLPMRRLGCRLFTLCSALLLVLIVAAWGRSHTLGDYLRGYDPPRLLEVMSSAGLFRVASGSLTSSDYSPDAGWEGTFWPFERRTSRFTADLRRGTTLGFGYERDRRQQAKVSTNAHIVTVPYWLLAALAAVPLAVGVMRWWRDRRCREGCCPGCWHANRPPVSITGG